MNRLAGKRAIVTGAAQGQGAAIAFLLFALILVLTTVQRWFLRDKDEAAGKKALRQQKRRTD